VAAVAPEGRRVFDVVGLFMKNWEDDDTDEYCTSRARDLVDGGPAVADVIGIELEAVKLCGRITASGCLRPSLREYGGGPHAESGRALQQRDQVPLRSSTMPARSAADHIATGH